MSKPQKTYQALATKLPRRLLADVGDIIVAWGALEYQVHRLICAGYSLSNETARALTIGMDIGAACGTLRTLAHNNHWIKDANLRTKIRALAAHIQEGSEARHQYAHGVFAFDFDAPADFAKYRIKSADERVKPVAERLDRKKMKQHAERARLVRQALDLTLHVRAALQKSL